MSEDMFNRMEKKLDILVSDVNEIKIQGAKRDIILEEHTSRSTKLEDIVLPIQRKITLLEGAMKLLASGSVIAGIIEAIRMLSGH